MLTQPRLLPFSRRVIGEYLMFGVAGVFICISLISAFGYHGRVPDYLGSVAVGALGVLVVGAIVLHRTTRVNQAIEDQLRREAVRALSDPSLMEPLAESDSTAIGWNTILRRLRELNTVSALEARLRCP